jgi:hypothetical protein
MMSVFAPWYEAEPFFSPDWTPGRPDQSNSAADNPPAPAHEAQPRSHPTFVVAVGRAWTRQGNRIPFGVENT